MHLTSAHRHGSELSIDVRQSGIQRTERRRVMRCLLIHFDVLSMLILEVVVRVGGRKGRFDVLAERDEEIVERVHFGAGVVGSGTD